MKKIDPPAIKVETIVDTCCQRVRSLVERALLGALRPHLVSEEAGYVSQGAQGTLHALRERLTNEMHKKLLRKIYTDKLANAKGCCREFYDKIIVLSSNTCPYCEAGSVTTLDHFLPKSQFPTFSITPTNLVPACSRCNFLKDSFSPLIQSDALVHPYFEDTEKDIWLYAKLDFATGFVSFIADPGPGFSPAEADKIRNTFRALHLAERYEVKGNSELGFLKEWVPKFLESFSDKNMHSRIFLRLLKSQYETKKLHSKNSWDSALYRALCSIPAYYNGGYLIFGGG